RAGAAVLSGEVLRSECAALSPETGGGARNQAELHLGQAGAAGSGTGGAGAQAGNASQAAPAPAAAGDAVAHRWQPTSLVPVLLLLPASTDPAAVTSVKSGTEKSSGGPNTVCRRHGSEQPKPVAIHPNAQRTPMNNNVPSNADTNDQRPDSVNCDTNPTIEAAHEYFELFL